MNTQYFKNWEYIIHRNFVHVILNIVNSIETDTVSSLVISPCITNRGSCTFDYDNITFVCKADLLYPNVVLTKSPLQPANRHYWKLLLTLQLCRLMKWTIRHITISDKIITLLYSTNNFSGYTKLGKPSLKKTDPPSAYWRMSIRKCFFLLKASLNYYGENDYLNIHLLVLIST